MTIRKFEEYLKKGKVKKQSPNVERAKALAKEAEEKKEFLEISLDNIPKDKMNANFVVDYCYDIIMELIRSEMYKNGYNPGNSHEAEVSYMEKLGFSMAETRFMDELRYFRNGTKYYGTILDYEYAANVLKFLKKVYPRLKNPKII